MKKKLIDDIIVMLKNPDEIWIDDDLTFCHAKSGIRIWNANIPILDTCIYKPAEVSLNLVDKFRVYFAMQTAKENIIRRAMK